MRVLLALLPLSAALFAQDYGETHRLKVDVAGESRKVAFFVPKNPRRNESFPLLVTVPASDGRSFSEVGQWEQPASDKRFAVMAVDVTTASVRKPWHPNDRLDMQRDMEAVLAALEAVEQKASELEIELDESAIAITGHSGGTFLALWLGLRRADLFLGICGRSVCFYPETLDFGDFENVELNKKQPILLFRGEYDAARCKRETELAHEKLKEAGWTDVTYDIVEKMSHESKPEVAVEWFVDLLKRTEKGRRERRKIAEELPEVREDLEAGKASALSKLLRLVEREEKAGFAAGAKALLRKIEAKAEETFQRAENLAAESQLFEAAELYRTVERDYRTLDVGKRAREARLALERSDAYEAAELLQRAKEYREKGRKEQAFSLLEKIVEKYPETPAADEARHLMKG